MSAPGLGQFRVPQPSTVVTSYGPVVVRDAGTDGVAVVMAHGWAADGLTNWLRAFEPLVAAGYRPVAVDLPGHGGTPLAGEFALQDCALVVAEICHYVGTPAVLLGYSMGGPVMQLAARDHLDAVGLVHIATAARLAPTALERGLLGGLHRAGSLAVAAVATLRFLASAAAPAAGDVEHDLSAHAAWLAKNASKRALVEAAGELARFDSRAWVADLDTEAVSVITTADRAVPPSSQRELADLTRAVVHEIPYGHLACLRPGFGRMVTDVVAQLAQPTAVVREPTEPPGRRRTAL